MKGLLFAAFLVVHLVLVVVYWFVSYDPTGTVLLAGFGLAMGVMGWVLIPTFGDVGPTAPVDVDWHERD